MSMAGGPIGGCPASLVNVVCGPSDGGDPLRCVGIGWDGREGNVINGAGRL